MTAFLGIERSATGRRWIAPGAEVERQGLAMSQATGMPEIVARLLAAKGITTETAEDYLTPTLRALMPDPSSLMDMDAAAERLARAVISRERVAVFGDYDVDGGASVAMMVSWLRTMGLGATPYIPDRIDEGYGPNEPAMAALGRDHDMVICVDCGTLSHDPVEAARAEGADVLIVDHHLPGETLPNAICVNPNRADDVAGLGYLCAAGVVFFLLVATNRLLRAQKAFPGAEPDLMAMLDLVAVATVADVAPMIGLNRALVRQGIAVLGKRRRVGLVALADVAKLTAPPTSRDLGWAFGPRINAGGRIGAADLGARLLCTDDPNEAAALAEKLDSLNAERRAIEATVLDLATDQVEARASETGLVWAAGEGWHPGVVGIVASRLKERFNRPAVVIGLAGSEGKGSGRSVTGIDLGSCIGALAREGLLLKGGGHKMAAGLTLSAEQVAPAMARLDEMLTAQGAATVGPSDLEVLGALAPGGATPDLIEQLESAGPFGPSNPAPRLAFPDVIPSKPRIVGNGHAQVRFSGSGGTVAAIAFGARDNGLAELLEACAATKRPLHVAGRLEIDDWGGRRQAKLRLEDLAEPNR
ncbi:MAG: single-stranded-DNA-specific exonuclease RecJ [Paracoccaceae bacterium]